MSPIAQVNYIYFFNTSNLIRSMSKTQKAIYYNSYTYTQIVEVINEYFCIPNKIFRCMFLAHSTNNVSIHYGQWF